MTSPTLQRIARWILLTALLLVLTLIFVLDRHYSSVMLFLIPSVGYALVGFVVSTRRPQNAIGWIFLSVGLIGSLISLVNVGTDATLAADEPVAWWGVLAAWGYAVLWLPALMLVTTFTFLLFPSGLPSRRWRPILWLAVTSTLSATAILAMIPTLDIGDPQTDVGALTVNNPLSPPQAAGWVEDGTPWWVKGLFALCVFCAAASIVAVVVRMHRARGVERQQMRVFAFAVALFPAQIILSSLTNAFGNPTVDEVSFTVVMACMPVACGVAILRYRLYDIDRIIGRTTAYAIVTGLLLAVYALVVTSVTRLLPGTSNAFAVAAATLAAAALFRPLLSRVQAFVDRRFNRTRYDAQRTVEAFASRLRDQVDPDDVSADLLTVLRQTVQPSGAALWLREAQR